LNWQATAAEVEQLPFVPRVEWRDEVPSTNTIAMRLAEDGAPSGTLVVARQQSNGRGRMGRHWCSLPGEHIYLSVVWRPPWPPERASQITLDAAVAVARCVDRWIDGRPALKWPNDVLIHGQKCAGLLGEMRATSGRLDFVVIGIGLNVDAVEEVVPPELADIATAIGDHSTEATNRTNVLVSLITDLHLGHQALVKRGAFDREGWCSFAETLGQEVRVTLPGSETFTAIAETLSDVGTLVVRKNDGTLCEIVAGDVVVQRGGSNAAGR